MRLLIVIITFLWLCCGIGYVFYEPKMMSYSIAVTGLIAFLTAVANYRQGTKKENSGQTQEVTSNSFGIQVGGDFHVNKKDKK